MWAKTDATGTPSCSLDNFAAKYWINLDIHFACA
jgi:hypothetical protein